MRLFQQRPVALMRTTLRAPILIYRWQLGWLLGGRFLLLEHTGRRSGLPRKTVLEVLRADRTLGRYYAASAWGTHADWYANVRETPQVTVTVGRRRHPAIARLLPPAESQRVLTEYRGEHRMAARVVLLLSGRKDWDELMAFLRVVEFAATK